MPSSTALSISIPSPPSVGAVLPAMPQTSSEIERELSSVRSLRRRSGSGSGTGSLGAFDPDLPPTKDDIELATGLGMALPGTSLSPIRTSPVSGSFPGGSSSNPGSRSGSSPVDRRAGRTFAGPAHDDDDETADRDAQLFWVPAHLHPELAPSEFRAFLKEHAHAHAQEAEEAQASPPGAFPTSSASSSPSAAPFGSPVQRASSLSRKRSMLSRQYQPRPNDGVEAEPTPALPSRRLSHRSNRSSIYASPFATDEEPGVSLMDLQKLEEMADEAAKSDDPSALRSLLKRSWSVNTGSSPDADAIDGVALANDYDSPVMPIRPGTGSLIRRGARTKIRKAGMDGDAPHRFGPSRRGKVPLVDEIPSLTADDEPLHGRRTPSDEDHARDERPMSTASLDAAGIYDSYLSSRDSVISPSGLSAQPQRGPSESPSPPDLGMSISLPALKVDEPFEPFSLSASSASSSSSHSHEEEEPSSPPTPTQEQFRPSVYIPTSTSETSLGSSSERISPPPSPDPASQSGAGPSAAPAFAVSDAHQVRRTDSTGSLASSAGSSVGSKEKKKKGFFSKKDKDDKKEKKPFGEKEKKGFSLFGGKKKQEEPPSPVNVTDGRLAAAALLKTKRPASPGGPVPPTAPALGASTNFARYPIHVERAVYRLSHIKLANPRRPLYEQVLISNLMFWYLSIINKKDDDKEKKVATPKEDADGEAEKAKGGNGQAMGKGTPPGHSTARDILNGTVAPPPVARRPSNPRSDDAQHQQPALAIKPPLVRNVEQGVRAPQYGSQAAQEQHLSRERGPPPGQQVVPPRGDSRPSPPPSAQHPPQMRPPPQAGPQRSGPGHQHERPDEGRPQPTPSYGGPAGPNGLHPNGRPQPTHLQQQHPQQQQQHQQQQQQQHQQQARPSNPPGYDLRLGQPIGSPGGPRSPGGPAQSRSPPPQGARPLQGAPPPLQINVRPPPPNGPSPPPGQQMARSPVNGSFPGQQPYPGQQPGRRAASDSHTSESPGPPYPGGPPRQPPSPQSPVRERSHSTSSPQPGQIFRPPPGSMPSPGGPRPGEVFSPNALPQIGQVFHHPGYRPAPYRPGGLPGGGPPPAGQQLQGHPPSQPRGPPPAGYYPPQQQAGSPPVQGRPPYPGGPLPPQGYAGPPNPSMRQPPPGQGYAPQQQQQQQRPPPPAGYYGPPPNGQQRQLPHGQGPPPSHPNYGLAPQHHYPAPMQGQRRTSNQGEVVDPRVR